MKKFLVVLLACALIFGFASTAMAADTQITEFSDIADQSQAAKTAIMKLAVLGVLEGNEGVGGPIRPADNLTRAEFAKIVCYLTGNTKSAEALANVASRFPDVQVGSWYTGWINMAVQAGYFQGDPSGNFRPNANITQNEVVAVVLRAMGYTDDLPGAWPGKYSTKAQAIEILDDVTFVGSAAATRADAAIICSAVLGKNMVVHIANDIAFAIALTDGTVDKDGYAEVYYMSNEDDSKTKYAETILHKAFKCVEPRVYFDFAGFAPNEEDSDASHQYDETAAWEYIDFKDGELQFNLSDSHLGTLDYADNAAYDFQYEVASTYYINKDFTLFDLAGMQSDIIVNDDDEVLFVNVRGSYVMANAIYDDNGRVNADGKTYRARSSASTIAGGSVEDLTDSLSGVKKDDALPGKVYLDKDGYAVAVKDYSQFNTAGFAIFDEVDEGVADYKVDNMSGKASDRKMDTAEPYAVIKDGKLIKAEDLDEFDLLYYAGEIGNKVHTFLAYAPVEGEMTAQNKTDGKLTLDAKAYRGVTNFQYSDDGGDNFNDATIAGLTIDTGSFGEAFYVPAYNWLRVAYVAANATNNKVIGVVTSFEPASVWDSGSSFLAQYQKITIMNTEGKEVTYTFHKDFRNAYNVMMDSFGATANYKWDAKYDDDASNDTLGADLWDSVAGTTDDKPNKGEDIVEIAEGDIIQLTLDKSDNVKKVANYAAYALNDGSENNGGGPYVYDAKLTVSSTRERITISDETSVSANPVSGTTPGTFTLPSDAIVFCATPDNDGDFDETNIVSVASVLAADFTASKAVAFDTKSSGSISVLYYIGDVSTFRFGVITNDGVDSTGEYYMVNGAKVYNGDAADITTSGLWMYYMSGGEAYLDTELAWGTGEDTDYLDDGTIEGLTFVGEDHKGVVGVVDSYSSGTKAVKIGSLYIYVTSDTYIYDLYEDDDATTSDLKGNTVVAIYNDDYEAVAIAIVSGTPDAEAGAGPVGSGKALLDNMIANAGIKAAKWEATDDKLILGDDDTIYSNVTVPNGVNMIVEEGNTLTVRAKLTLKNGSSLEVDSADLALGSGGSIVVEKGASLIIDGNELLGTGGVVVIDNGIVTITPGSIVLTIEGNAKLTDDWRMGSNYKLVVKSGSLDLNGHMLRLDGGTLACNGKLTLSDGSLLLIDSLDNLSGSGSIAISAGATLAVGDGGEGTVAYVSNAAALEDILGTEAEEGAVEAALALTPINLTSGVLTVKGNNGGFLATLEANAVATLNVSATLGSKDALVINGTLKIADNKTLDEGNGAVTTGSKGKIVKNGEEGDVVIEPDEGVYAGTDTEE